MLVHTRPAQAYGGHSNAAYNTAFMQNQPSYPPSFPASAYTNHGHLHSTASYGGNTPAGASEFGALPPLAPASTPKRPFQLEQEECNSNKRICPNGQQSSGSDLAGAGNAPNNLAYSGRLNMEPYQQPTVPKDPAYDWSKYSFYYQK
jgi:hypothetical protein